METARKIKEAYCYTCTDIVKVFFLYNGCKLCELLHFPCSGLFHLNLVT
jgi:hypothetical protein